MKSARSSYPSLTSPFASISPLYSSFNSRMYPNSADVLLIASSRASLRLLYSCFRSDAVSIASSSASDSPYSACIASSDRFRIVTIAAPSATTPATTHVAGDANHAAFNATCAAPAASVVVFRIPTSVPSFVITGAIVFAVETKLAALLVTNIVPSAAPTPFAPDLTASELSATYANRSATPLTTFPTSSAISFVSSVSIVREISRIDRLISGDAFSKTSIILPWILDCRSVSWPFTLSFMVAAISAAAPVEFSTADVSLSKSSGAALTIASRPDIASCPAMCFAADVCSALSRPLKAFLRSPMTSDMSFMLPSASVSDSPRRSISVAHSFGGADSLVRIDRSAVPDFSPLIPALAIRPIATAASSML